MAFGTVTVVVSTLAGFATVALSFRVTASEADCIDDDVVGWLGTLCPVAVLDAESAAESLVTVVWLPGFGRAGGNSS
jgi:hypothetical protein